MNVIPFLHVACYFCSERTALLLSSRLCRRPSNYLASPFWILKRDLFLPLSEPEFPSGLIKSYLILSYLYVLQPHIALIQKKCTLCNSPACAERLQYKCTFARRVTSDDAKYVIWRRLCYRCNCNIVHLVLRCGASAIAAGSGSKKHRIPSAGRRKRCF